MQTTTQTPTTLAQKTLEFAISQVGVQEMPKGSNSGPRINQYLASVGLAPGNSWCMAFVYWCVSKASDSLKIAPPIVKTGGVLKQWNETHCLKVGGLSKAVAPGDIFILDFGGGVGHTGIVERVGLGCVYTIEGNTNEDGSREGYEVARRVRSITSLKLKGFIKI